jgi:molecular chaperone GrpE (heat shock protein)
MHALKQRKEKRGLLSHKFSTADIWKNFLSVIDIIRIFVQYGDKDDLEAQNFKFYPGISNLSLKIRNIKTGSTNL